MMHFPSRKLSSPGTCCHAACPRLLPRCPLMFQAGNHRGALPSTGGDFSFLRSDFRTVKKDGRENGLAETRAGSWFGGASADFRSRFGDGSVIQAIVLRQTF